MRKEYFNVSSLVEKLYREGSADNVVINLNEFFKQGKRLPFKLVSLDDFNKVLSNVDYRKLINQDTLVDELTDAFVLFLQKKKEAQ